jgi:hypothetical protein
MLERLKAKLLGSSKGGGKFTDLFISSKNPKNLLTAFKKEYEKEIKAAGPNHNGKLRKKGYNLVEYRESFFKDTLLSHLQSKHYKRRKNAFYILAYLMQSDAAHFP